MQRKRLLSAESLECRRVLTSSLGWDGPGLGSADLTYHIGDAPAYLNQQEVEAAIETALDSWSEVVDINFTQTNRPGLRDSIDFSFVNIDGRGSTLAQAYFPDDVNPARIAGDIQFDTSDPWEIGNSLGRSAFDLVSVAVHEVGHALGLDHIHESESILAPSISPNAEFTGLSTHDVEAIQNLYAPLSILDGGHDEHDEHTHSSSPTAPTAPDASTDTPNSNGGRWFAWNPWNNSRWNIVISGFNFRWTGFGGIQAGNAEGHNANNPADVNNDAVVSPVDALLVINALNSGTSFTEMTHLCDTNNDGELSPVDALNVVNQLNQPDGERPINEPENSPNSPPHTEHHGEPDSKTDLDLVSEMAQDAPPPLFAGLGLGLGGPFGMLRDDAVDVLFDAFDENSNGALTQSEVPQFAWDYMLREGIDSDTNGEITDAEVDAAIVARKQDRFDTIDDNGNGLLEESELAPFAYQRLKNADTNGDSGISFDELQAFQSLTRFQKLDTNDDSQITQDEVGERQWVRLLRFDDNGDEIITEDELPQGPKLGDRFTRMAEMAARIFRFTRRFT